VYLKFLDTTCIYVHWPWKIQKELTNKEYILVKHLHINTNGRLNMRSYLNTKTNEMLSIRIVAAIREH
jgi:hypothetical protein